MKIWLWILWLVAQIPTWVYGGNWIKGLMFAIFFGWVCSTFRPRPVVFEA